MASRCSEIVRVHFLSWAIWGRVFVCDENPGQGPTALMGPHNASSLLRIFFGRLCKWGPLQPLFLFFVCGDCGAPGGQEAGHYLGIKRSQGHGQ